MNENEIITALECCNNEQICDECPYSINGLCVDLTQDALDLIKRKNAENEELKHRNQKLTSDLTSAKATEKELMERLNFLEQEYKKLYERNKKLLLKLCEKTGKASKIVEKIISSKARKEFADEFLEELNQENDLYVRCAKNLLSEDFQRGYEEKNDNIVKIVRHLLKEVETDE